MQSLPEKNEAAAKAALLLLAVLLNALEFFAPRIPLFPWLKPGLANCVTVAWIIRYGALDALLFSLVRVWITGFYFGFSFLTLGLALSGAVAATAAMGIVWSAAGKRDLMGVVGMGIVGALFHNAGQLALVYVLVARNLSILYQLPVMILASIVFGGLVGWIAPAVWALPAATAAARIRTMPVAPSGALLRVAASLAVLAASFSLVFVARLDTLCACAAGAVLLVQVLSRGSLRAIWLPVRRFWLLFAFVAALHLFFTFGRRLETFPPVTVEGVQIAGQQCLRIFTWLQLSAVLARLEFHTIFFEFLRRCFPSRHDTLAAGLLALEYAPQAVALAGRPRMRHLAALLRHPSKTLSAALHGYHARLVACICEA